MGTRRALLLAPQEAAARFPADPDAIRGDQRARRAARVRPDARARLSLPRLLRPGRSRRRPARAASARRAFDERYRTRTTARLRTRADERLREELALIAEIGLSGFFLLHWEVLELAREVAAEVRGPGSPRHLLPPGARPRQLGRLDRLLPHRTLARRSGRLRPRARALPEPRARLRAGHRPRLPARHPREADRRGHRALRARALGARGELRHLPLARRDPRRRQGARAPAVRARAPRTRLGRLERAQGGGGDGVRPRRRRSA